MLEMVRCLSRGYPLKRTFTGKAHRTCQRKCDANYYDDTPLHDAANIGSHAISDIAAEKFPIIPAGSLNIVFLTVVLLWRRWNPAPRGRSSPHSSW